MVVVFVTPAGPRAARVGGPGGVRRSARVRPTRRLRSRSSRRNRFRDRCPDGWPLDILMRRFAYSSVVQLAWHHSTTSLPCFLKRSQIDYLFFGGMAGMAGMAGVALRCSDRPILGLLGPAFEGARAAPVGHALSVWH